MLTPLMRRTVALASLEPLAGGALGGGSDGSTKDECHGEKGGHNGRGGGIGGAGGGRGQRLHVRSCKEQWPTVDE